jgi:hypothetical protein
MLSDVWYDWLVTGFSSHSAFVIIGRVTFLLLVYHTPSPLCFIVAHACGGG